MSDPLPFSFECDVPWHDMLGEGRRRLCTQCNEQVVDLSALTKAEAEAVLATRGVCVSYVQANGQVVYASEPRAAQSVGQEARAGARQRSRRRKLLRFAAAAASGLVGGVAHAGAAPADLDPPSWTTVRDWLTSWFDHGAADEDVVVAPRAENRVPRREERLRRTGLLVFVEQKSSASVTMPASEGFTSADLLCDGESLHTAVTAGRASFDVVDGPQGMGCALTFRPGDVEVLLALGQELSCRVGDDGVVCERAATEGSAATGLGDPPM